MPSEGSGALMAQAILGDEAKIVDAFQNVSLNTSYLVRRLTLTFWLLAMINCQRIGYSALCGYGC